MKKKIIVLFLTCCLCALPGYTKEPTGTASKEGKVSATALTWGVIGIGLLVAIGIVVAVTLSQSNDKVIIVKDH